MQRPKEGGGGGKGQERAHTDTAHHQCTREMRGQGGWRAEAATTWARPWALSPGDPSGAPPCCSQASCPQVPCLPLPAPARETVCTCGTSRPAWRGGGGSGETVQPWGCLAKPSGALPGPQDSDSSKTDSELPWNCPLTPAVSSAAAAARAAFPEGRGTGATGQGHGGGGVPRSQLSRHNHHRVLSHGAPALGAQKERPFL